MRWRTIRAGAGLYCSEERSQLRNRERAVALLRSKLYEEQLRKHEAGIADARKTQVGTGDRSEKIRTYNFPQNRLTDHRINHSWHNLEEILEGNCGPILEEMVQRRIALLLERGP